MAPRRTGPARCIAPRGDVPADGLAGVDLCGEPASSSRVVEGLECALCQAHADQIDTERAAGESE